MKWRRTWSCSKLPAVAQLVVKAARLPVSAWAPSFIVVSDAKEVNPGVGNVESEGRLHAPRFVLFTFSIA